MNQKKLNDFGEFVKLLDFKYSEDVGDDVNSDIDDDEMTQDEMTQGYGKYTVHSDANRGSNLELEDLLAYLPKELKYFFVRLFDQSSTMPDQDTIKKFCLCIYFGVNMGYAYHGMNMIQHTPCCENENKDDVACIKKEAPCKVCQEGERKKAERTKLKEKKRRKKTKDKYYDEEKKL